MVVVFLEQKTVLIPLSLIDFRSTTCFLLPLRRVLYSPSSWFVAAHSAQAAHSVQDDEVDGGGGGGTPEAAVAAVVGAAATPPLFVWLVLRAANMAARCCCSR